MLQSAIDRDAQIINYATWNDWPEGQHLAPEVNHNFGPSLLLRHFAALWRGQPPPFDDLAAVFFKKHPSTATPAHPVAVKVKSLRNDPAAEDEIQLVTVLKSAVECRYNDKNSGIIQPGFQITALPLPPDGPIHIRLSLPGSGKTVAEFVTPVGVTRSPMRVDRLTYSYSNKDLDEFHALFGDMKMPLPASASPGQD